MAMDSSGIDRVQQAVAQAVRDHWVLFLIEGIVLVLLGVLAVLVPMVATIAVTILIGWLFCISGVVAGIILLGWPVLGAVSLTLLMTAFFTIEGIASIMYSLEHRKELTGRWTWMLVSGIVDLILAFIILTGLPGTAAWALGLLVGINMLFGGTSMIAMALHARGSGPSVRQPA